MPGADPAGPACAPEAATARSWALSAYLGDLAIGPGAASEVPPEHREAFLDRFGCSGVVIDAWWARTRQRPNLGGQRRVDAAGDLLHILGAGQSAAHRRTFALMTLAQVLQWAMSTPPHIDEVDHIPAAEAAWCGLAHGWLAAAAGFTPAECTGGVPVDQALVMLGLRDGALAACAAYLLPY